MSLTYRHGFFVEPIVADGRVNAPDVAGQDPITSLGLATLSRLYWYLKSSTISVGIGYSLTSGEDPDTVSWSGSVSGSAVSSTYPEPGSRVVQPAASFPSALISLIDNGVYTASDGTTTPYSNACGAQFNWFEGFGTSDGVFTKGGEAPMGSVYVAKTTGGLYKTFYNCVCGDFGGTPTFVANPSTSGINSGSGVSLVLTFPTEAPLTIPLGMALLDGVSGGVSGTIEVAYDTFWT